MQLRHILRLSAIVFAAMALGCASSKRSEVANVDHLCNIPDKPTVIQVYEARERAVAARAAWEVRNQANHLSIEDTDALNHTIERSRIYEIRSEKADRAPIEYETGIKKK